MNQALPVSEANQLLHYLLNQSPDNELPLQTDKLLCEARHIQQADRAAHMTPKLAPYSLLGMQLAMLHQGNLLSAELYPQLQQAEQYTLDWLKNGFGLPYAYFTHGGSYNNLQALWQAKEHSTTARRSVYASEACHYSVAKACRILGLDLQLITVDKDDRLDVEQLARACADEAPLAIILTAGTSVLGAMDPFDATMAVARQYQSWLHIDASWGGACLLLPEFRAAYATIRQADSLAFDPHKSLFQPRPCSVYLSRHNLDQMEQTDYLTAAPTERLTGSYGAELFLPLWLNLLLLGEDWFFSQTRARLSEAEHFAEILKRQTDWPLWHAGSGIVCFSAPDRIGDKLVSMGKLSRARIGQQNVCRAVFAGYDTKARALIKALHLFP